MNALGKRRILALSKYMETVPPERFDMHFYVTGGTGFDEKNLMTGCGTTACALGWATQMPMFKRLGLRLTHSFVSLDGFCAMDATWELLGLSREEHHDLFGTLEGKIRTPKQWAKYARKYVKGIDTKRNKDNEDE